MTWLIMRHRCPKHRPVAKNQLRNYEWKESLYGTWMPIIDESATTSIKVISVMIAGMIGVAWVAFNNAITGGVVCFLYCKLISLM